MRFFIALASAAISLVATPASAQDPYAPAAAQELRQICEADRARLWGVDLCGPLMVADPATRNVWASQPDWTGVLRPNGAGYTGTLPAGVTIANTSVEWANVRWIMMVTPLPEDAAERRVLVAHEAWHRVQNQLNLPLSSSANAHLETERGRYLMRLEFRALATAMRSRDNARRSAARDALYFRMARLNEFLQANADEAALDRNEGLASYTGVKLGAGENAYLYAARTLDRYDRQEAFARSYAYASGPAYGLLLDQFQPNWRRNLGAFAPADRLRITIRSEAFDPTQLETMAARYGGATIANEESIRTRDQTERIAGLRQRFAAGPRLVLPVRNMQMEFDPQAVTPVDGLGNVYSTLTVRDSWGELRAADGALISTDFTRIVLPAPNPDGLSGPGWSVSLVAGAHLFGPDGDGVRTVAAP
jgi:hypothetical protein